MRRNRTFAYDLVVCHGAVNSRVVLLLRSIEAKPPTPISSNSFSCFQGGLGGGEAAHYERRDFGINKLNMTWALIHVNRYQEGVGNAARVFLRVISKAVLPQAE